MVYSIALECNTGSFKCDSNKTQSCFVSFLFWIIFFLWEFFFFDLFKQVGSKDGAITYSCDEMKNCTLLINNFLLENRYTIHCCNEDFCNSFEQLRNNITCFDTVEKNSTCQSSGVCYVNFKILIYIFNHKI